MEDEIYIHEKGKKKGALRAKFLEAMNECHYSWEE